MLADPEAWFAHERPTLVAGIGRLCRVDDFCEGEYVLAAGMFDRLAAYLWLHGYYADLRFCAEALAAAAREDGNELVEVRAEAVLVRLLHLRGAYAAAVVRYRRCAERLARLGDGRTRAWVLTNLADCLTGLGEPEEALRWPTRAAQADPDDDFTELSVLRARSAALNRLGRPAESVRLDTAALDVARRSEEPRTVALALQSLSWSLALTGELDAAADAAGESVSLLRGTTARARRSPARCARSARSTPGRAGGPPPSTRSPRAGGSPRRSTSGRGSCRARGRWRRAGSAPAGPRTRSRSCGAASRRTGRWAAGRRPR